MDTEQKRQRYDFLKAYAELGPGGLTAAEYAELQDLELALLKKDERLSREMRQIIEVVEQIKREVRANKTTRAA